MHCLYIDSYTELQNAADNAQLLYDKGVHVLVFGLGLHAATDGTPVLDAGLLATPYKFPSPTGQAADRFKTWNLRCCAIVVPSKWEAAAAANDIPATQVAWHCYQWLTGIRAKLSGVAHVGQPFSQRGGRFLRQLRSGRHGLGERMAIVDLSTEAAAGDDYPAWAAGRGLACVVGRTALLVDGDGYLDLDYLEWVCDPGSKWFVALNHIAQPVVGGPGEAQAREQIVRLTTAGWGVWLKSTGLASSIVIEG